MFIEGDGRLIFRIDDQGENGRISAGCAPGSVDDESAAQPLTAEALIDCEPPDQCRGERTVARQSSGFLGVR